MVYRWDFPGGAILLVAFLVGGITAEQLITTYVGRVAKRQNGNGNGNG